MSEVSDLCPTCKNGNLGPSGQVLIEGQSVGEYRDLGSRRVFICNNCGQKQIRIGVHEYAPIGDDVRTRPHDSLSQPQGK